MADHRGGRGYPPRESSDGSSYPPPPEDDNDRRSQYPRPPPPTASVSLPPLSSYQPAPPPLPATMYQSDPRYPDPRYSQDQRAWPPEPPSNPNGYPPPAEPRYPPPPPVSSDPRPYNDRSRGYEDPRQYDERSRQYDRSAYPDPYYGSQPDQRAVQYTYPPYPPPPPHGYQYPPQQQVPPPQPQAAPRQRTSIACRYCRKRKIRCSGYANTPNGKCTNCDKLKIDCVFQPVSSNASTAFVPVSAIAGGVPPGTPLYGAYGQPLSTAGQSSSGLQPYSVAPSDYPPPAHSPSSQYPPLDDRDRDMARRRTRPPDDGHDLRLPPPNYPTNEDPRRRSPSSNHSNGTPPMAHHSYPPTGYDQGPPDAPRRVSPSGPPPTSQLSSNPMSLNHLIGSPESRDRGSGRDIDRNMLGKLDRRP